MALQPANRSAGVTALRVHSAVFGGIFAPHSPCSSLATLVRFCPRCSPPTFCFFDHLLPSCVLRPPSIGCLPLHSSPFLPCSITGWPYPCPVHHGLLVILGPSPIQTVSAKSPKIQRTFHGLLPVSTHNRSRETHAIAGGPLKLGPWPMGKEDYGWKVYGPSKTGGSSFASPVFDGP